MTLHLKYTHVPKKRLKCTKPTKAMFTFVSTLLLKCPGSEVRVNIKAHWVKPLVSKYITAVHQLLLVTVASSNNTFPS